MISHWHESAFFALIAKRRRRSFAQVLFSNAVTRSHIRCLPLALTVNHEITRCPNMMPVAIPLPPFPPLSSSLLSSFSFAPLPPFPPRSLPPAFPLSHLPPSPPPHSPPPSSPLSHLPTPLPPALLPPFLFLILPLSAIYLVPRLFSVVIFVVICSSSFPYPPPLLLLSHPSSSSLSLFVLHPSSLSSFIPPFLFFLSSLHISHLSILLILSLFIIVSSFLPSFSSSSSSPCLFFLSLSPLSFLPLSSLCSSFSPCLFFLFLPSVSSSSFFFLSLPLSPLFVLLISPLSHVCSLRLLWSWFHRLSSDKFILNWCYQGLTRVQEVEGI